MATEMMSMMDAITKRRSHRKYIKVSSNFYCSLFCFLFHCDVYVD